MPDDDEAQEQEEDLRMMIGLLMGAGAVLVLARKWLPLVHVDAMPRGDIGAQSLSFAEVVPLPLWLPFIAGGALYAYSEWRRWLWLGRTGKVLAFIYLAALTVGGARFLYNPGRSVAQHYYTEYFDYTLFDWLDESEESVEWISSQFAPFVDVNIVWAGVIGVCLALAWIAYWNVTVAKRPATQEESP